MNCNKIGQIFVDLLLNVFWWIKEEGPIMSKDFSLSSSPQMHFIYLYIQHFFFWWIKNPLLAPSMAKKISQRISLAQMGNFDGRGIPFRVIMLTNRIHTKSIFSRRLSQVIFFDHDDINSFSCGFNMYYKLVLWLFRCLHDYHDEIVA